LFKIAPPPQVGIASQRTGRLLLCGGMTRGGYSLFGLCHSRRSASLPTGRTAIDKLADSGDLPLRASVDCAAPLAYCMIDLSLYPSKRAAQSL
jgi:hypothetical protein